MSSKNWKTQNWSVYLKSTYNSVRRKVFVSGVRIDSIPDGRLEVYDENDAVITRFPAEVWSWVVVEKLRTVTEEEEILTNNS